jgi:predicted AAA+ superfamily ATPase
VNRNEEIMIERQLHTQISEKLSTGRAILVIGPRRVGKTTLLNAFLKNKSYLFLDGDDPKVRELLTNANTELLKTILGKNESVFIDEAQRIPNIGLTLKIITDQFKNVQLFVSGSSALDLNSTINEPLTGRKWDFQLFPISWQELENHLGYVAAAQQLETRILYGMYPEVITHQGEEIDYLKELSDSYLYKDLLSYGGIRKPEVLEKLVRALALQIGNEVSYNELSQLIGIDKNTVSNYIDLLIKTYVIFKLPSFSRNLRNEIKTNQKIYFYDTGIRNMVIGNFNSLENRNDKGALWENFLISERLKQRFYTKSIANAYFWRTRIQQEIDYVEEGSGKITGYEFKWNPKTKIKKHPIFQETYNADIEMVSQDNFRNFILA